MWCNLLKIIQRIIIFLKGSASEYNTFVSKVSVEEVTVIYYNTFVQNVGVCVY